MTSGVTPDNPMPMDIPSPQRPVHPAPLQRGPDRAFVLRPCTARLCTASRTVFDIPAGEALVTFQQFSNQSSGTFAGGAAIIERSANLQYFVVESQGSVVLPAKKAANPNHCFHGGDAMANLTLKEIP